MWLWRRLWRGESGQQDEAASRSNQAWAPGAPIRVLCLGDSLTEGFVGGPSGMPTGFAPYADQLLRLANEHGLADLEVDQQGVSGERVVPFMVQRLKGVLREASAAGRQYTHIILEGGFNDVGTGRPAEQTFAALKDMYQEALQTGAHVVAMTLYEYGPRPDGPQSDELARVLERYGKARRRLNQLIREHVSTSSKRGAKMSLVDLEARIPPHTEPSPAPSAESSSLYSDALHLTAEGYERMAELVWDEVFARHLPQTPAAAGS